MTPSSFHPYNCQDFILLLFLNLSETFALNDEVTAFQEVMLKGKPVKLLNDSNLNQIRWGTGPFRIRSLSIYLKQVSHHSIKLFSQDVFIQKWRFQTTFHTNNHLFMAFPFHSGDITGWDVPKEKMIKCSVQFSSVVLFPSFISSAASSDQQEAPEAALLKIRSEWISAHQRFPEQQNWG